MNAAFRAESLKVRRSAASRVPLAGLLIAVLQGSLFLLSAAAIHSWRGLTAWQTLWITFLLPLFLALLAGLTAQREVRAQGGGLWWRAAPWTVQGQAELLWLGLLALGMNAAVVLPTLPFGLLAGLPGEVPWLRLVQLTLVLTLTSWPLLALGQRVARRLGLVTGLVLAFLGNVSGVFMSEGPWWFLSPWSWPIRATFTLSGTAANGTPLPEGSPLWNVSPWPVVAAALLTTVVLAAWPYALPNVSGAGRRSANAGSLKPWRWNGPLAAELVKYRHTALPWLVVLTPGLVALLGLLRVDARSVWELWVLLVLPFAAALISALVWGWEAEHWRILRSRAVSPGRLYGVKLLGMWLAAFVSGALLFGLMTLFGKPFAQPGLLLSLYILSSFAFLAFQLWAAVRFTPGVTLGVGVVATLLAAILGATGLGGGIWPFFPWVWARILPSSEGVTVWPFLLALLGMGLVFSWLGMRAARER